MYFVIIFITSVYLSNVFASVCTKVCNTVEYGGLSRVTRGFWVVGPVPRVVWTFLGTLAPAMANLILSFFVELANQLRSTLSIASKRCWTR